MNISKKHHIIPQFYIRNFSPDIEKEDNKKRVYIYSKGKEFEPIRFLNISQTACENNFYSSMIDQQRNDVLEKTLAEVENKAANSLKKFMREETLTQEEKVYLAQFISIMFTRTRTARRQFSEIEANDAQEKLYNHFKNSEELEEPYIKENLDEETFKKLHERILNEGINGFIYEVPKEKTFEAMLGSEEIAFLLCKMHWRLLRAPENRFFITSDHPVTHEVFDLHNGIGIKNKTAQITLPLSPELCWYASWRNIRQSFKLNPEFLKATNRRTVIYAEKEVFCHRDDIGIKSLVNKYRNDFISLKQNNHYFANSPAKVEIKR